MMGIAGMTIHEALTGNPTDHECMQRPMPAWALLRGRHVGA